MSSAAGLVLWMLAGILVSLAEAARITTKSPEVHEYCLPETFNATCPHGHVILMRSATYGRMRGGRCVSNDVGHMGCSTNVLSTLDKDCSGRTSCLVEVRNLLEVSPCRKDFMSYLEASYICVKMPETDLTQLCHDTGSILMKGHSSGYLAPVTMDTASMLTCPWKIEVPQGQRINLTLLDFMAEARRKGSYGHDGTGKHSTRCAGKFILVETVGGEDQTKEVSQCDEIVRESRMYKSHTNSLLVYLDHSTQRSFGSLTPGYLIHYQAVGCADPTVPADTWMKRSGDNLIVKCNDTQETWYLTCQDNHWIGEIGNCTHVAGRAHGSGEKRKDAGGSFPPHGIILAVLIGVVLGVFIGSGMLLTVHCIRRRKREMSARERDSSLLMQTKDGDGRGGTVGLGGGRVADNNPYPALLMDVETHIDIEKHYVDYAIPPQYMPCTCGDPSHELMLEGEAGGVVNAGELARLQPMGGGGGGGGGGGTLPFHTFGVKANNTSTGATDAGGGGERRDGGRGLYERPLYPPGMRTPGGEPPNVVYYDMGKDRVTAIPRAASLPRQTVVPSSGKLERRNTEMR